MTVPWKYFSLVLGLSILLTHQNLQSDELTLNGLHEIPDENIQMSPDQFILLTQIQEELERQDDMQNLRLAKQYIISGKTDLARFFLNRVGEDSTQLRLIRDRYRAVIALIEDDMVGAIRTLSHKDFDQIHLYPHICLMKVLALMAQPASRELQIELGRCREATESYTTNDHFWLDSLEKLKFQRERELRGTYLSDVNYLLSSNEIVRIWLKIGLYFNQEDLIMRHLSTMPQSIYNSPRARELLGMLYYRLGDYKMALEFTEGIESPTVENIRGNIELSERRHELAFGHFKLALGLKENSLNAIERALPLAWKLEQWADAHELLNKLIRPELDPRLIHSLRTAILIKEQDYEYAQEYLTYLSRSYNHNFPLEIELMQMYVALRLGNSKLITSSSERACSRFDGIACWMAQSNMIWSNIGRTLDRTDTIYSNQRWNLGQLKRKMEYEPLDEVPILDQRDIIELDGEGLGIIPGVI